MGRKKGVDLGDTLQQSMSHLKVSYHTGTYVDVGKTLR